MKYMGSKRRIAKEILPIILRDRKENQTYWEPFVGGGNMIDKVTGPRIGMDSNPLAVQALQAIRDYAYWLPKDNKEFTEQDYNNRSERFPEIKGFASFAYSFGARCWQGWARNSGTRDYVEESYRSAQKQSPGLWGVELDDCRYDNYSPPPESIIYCDPPYADSKGYKDTFDHDHFWQWCRDMIAQGHRIFVSEYSAPDDFVCVWEKIVSSCLRTGDVKRSVEKLFVHESQVTQ